MEIKVVFFIIAIVYWVLKSFYGKSDAKNAPQPKSKVPNPVPDSSSRKSIDDILREFREEVEKKTNPQPVPVSKKVVKKQNLDWQEVSKGKIKPKKQLIRHEDYHAEHGEIQDITSIDEISVSEGSVYKFDKNNIDWKQAIIAKEILDRKYA